MKNHLYIFSRPGQSQGSANYLQTHLQVINALGNPSFVKIYLQRRYTQTV